MTRVNMMALKCVCSHSKDAHMHLNGLPVVCSRCNCALFSLPICIGCGHKGEGHQFPSGICVGCLCEGYRTTEKVKP